MAKESLDTIVVRDWRNDWFLDSVTRAFGAGGRRLPARIGSHGVAGFYERLVDSCGCARRGLRAVNRARRLVYFRARTSDAQTVDEALRRACFQRNRGSDMGKSPLVHGWPASAGTKASRYGFVYRLERVQHDFGDNGSGAF